MNFLAHAFLSFDQPKILVGNFIGDFVKGNLEDQFERGIIHGVRLHREIDRFTDFHPLVKESQLLLKPIFFRYSSVITDMFFDYFLAKNWSAYHDVPLEIFSRKVYGVIEEYLPLMPDKFNYAFSFMKKENWLVAYGTEAGIQRALTGFLSDTRRMNVALTRAKRKLIVIGDSATLGVHHFYREFLDYVEENKCYTSIYELMED